MLLTKEHSLLPLNSQMTVSQVAGAGMSPLAFDFVKCILGGGGQILI